MYSYVKRYRLIALSLFAFTLILFVYNRHLLSGKNFISCYREDGPTLIDISSYNPPKGKSIFFHETSCTFSDGYLKVTPRQACAVESAALMNPNYTVYLLYASPGVIREDNEIMNALLTYSNVHVLHVNYQRYLTNTPIENLMHDCTIEASQYPSSHASDVFRYVTLWKYGGIYLDLDVVVLKSLEDLAANCAGAESDNNVAAGVMRFESEGWGHELAHKCLEDLRDNFTGSDWGYNGPGTITRLLRKLCKEEKAKEMVKKDCKGFKVYPTDAFYVIPWPKWKNYFNVSYNDKIFDILRNSFVAHVWNMHSTSVQISIETDVPYTILARKYCPKVFAKCDKYF